MPLIPCTAVIWRHRLTCRRSRMLRTRRLGGRMRDPYLREFHHAQLACNWSGGRTRWRGGKISGGTRSAGKASAAAWRSKHKNPDAKPVQKFVLELFVGKACLSLAVLKRKLNGDAPMDAAHGFGVKRFGGIIWCHLSAGNMFTSLRAFSKLVPWLTKSRLLLKIMPTTSWT